MTTLYLTAGRQVTFKRCGVIGILNATPDSFSDGGQLDDAKQAAARINMMLKAGVEVLDVGGESTRPGHTPVDATTEIKRAIPIIKLIRSQDANVPISIDTRKAEVARAALAAGASFVNAVNGLDDPKMSQVVKEADCSLILMRHKTCQTPVVNSVNKQLELLVEQAVNSGLKKEQLLLDPGLGFGDLAKGDFNALPGGDIDANMALINKIKDYDQGLSVVIGTSRKRFVGEMTGVEDADQRLAGSIACAVLAATAGAAFVRAHDVPETIQALQCVYYKERET